MKQLIITGDDFGVSRAVNKAIELAHRDGVLSATSLMVGQAATADAVSRARNLPDLRVGLHIVLVQGKAVSDPKNIPDLVTGEGNFRNDLFLTGVRYFFMPGIRRQLEAEIHAQFQAFTDTGLPLDHVNAHNHLHLHPTILGLILKVGREFNLQAMRIPYEPLFNLKRDSTIEKMAKLLTLLGLAPWTLLMRRRLKKSAIVSNDYIFGLNDSGEMSESLLMELINGLPEGSSEIYFHPELIQDNGSELQALMSMNVIGLLARLQIKPGGFSDIIPDH